MVTVAPFQDATALLDDPAALREQAAREGFLYFRGLLPRDLVLELRRQFLTIIEKYGWLEQGSSLMDGLGNLEAIAQTPREALTFCGTGVHVEAYQDIQRLELFQQLAHDSHLIQLYENLFGEAVLPHPRNIARLMLPAGVNVPTPPHQDFIHIQGTENTWTCWFPVGDCPVTLGGLQVWRGSHRLGLLPVRAADGAGGLECYWNDEDEDWVGGDFSAGDILTFHSHTIHKSIPNQTGNRIRMSCDYRYQALSGPVHLSSLDVHCNIMSWDDIYRDWQNMELAYYWKKQQLNTVTEFDESIRAPRPY